MNKVGTVLGRRRARCFFVRLIASGLAVAGTCIFTAAADRAARLEPFAEGFVAPLALCEIPGNSGALLVVDQAGIVYRVSRETGERETFLDLTARLVSLRSGFDERGLLGIALHPEFLENRRFFVCYSAPLREGGPERWDHTSHVSRFTASEDFSTADPDSEKIILRIDQPQFNHNGGSLLFGTDGYLYISVGDGGGAHDVGRGHPPQGNGQDVTTLLGSVLRIDVDNGDPYSIPEDNPFVGGEGKGEIYAYGLRNVWGLSIDRENPDRLFAADVGQHMFEIVNLLRNGGNYGWNIREGFHCFDPNNPRTPPEDCPRTGARGEPLLDPILEYKNATGFQGDPEAYGVCVIGGYVYRGNALPHLHGRYIFGDWSQSWGLPKGALLIGTPPANGSIGERWEVDLFRISSHPDGQIDEFLLGIGEDGDGELYFLTNGNQGPNERNGKIYRLVPAGE